MRVQRLRIGVSLCLLGEKVRHDGGHKKDPFLTDILGKYVDWVPVCPEVEVGMGVPRESVQLVDSASGIRMMGVGSKKDWTDSMTAFSTMRAKQLRGLHGFIFKKNSPSCGVQNVPVCSPKGFKSGRGLFADALIRTHPLLPVEEEGRLQDPVVQENFIDRLFCYQRLTNLLVNSTELATFHARHKLTLLSHSPDHDRVLSRLAAKSPTEEVLQEYSRCFMDALKRKSTRRKHTNVLQHMSRFFSDKQDLILCIEEYRKGKVPLIIPIALLKKHLRNHPVPWIQEQVYLDPYPTELMLRNNI